MKQLITLVILFFGLTAQAQVVRDSGSICMPAVVAKQIASDLLKGDSAKVILNITSQELDITKSKMGYKDSIITAFKIKESLLSQQLRNETLQKEGYNALYNNVKIEYSTMAKSFKKYKVKSTFAIIILSAGVIASTGLLIYYK